MDLRLTDGKIRHGYLVPTSASDMGPGKLYLDGLAVIIRAEGQMKLATKYGEKLQVPYKQKPKRSIRCQSDTSDTTTMVIEVV
ncbi:hypothetical protein M404DRAFT_1009132, partial [Pisolithus tinctorius Marx 270]